MKNSVVLEQFKFQRNYLSLLVDDIPDGKLCEQPGGIVNHPAWQLGHLADSADQFLKLLGGETALSRPWHEKFGQGSMPQPRRSDYPSKEELLAKVDERRSALAGLVAEAGDEELLKPTGESYVDSVFPSRGHLALFGMMFHEGVHYGQIAAWRKAIGMPAALAKLRGRK